MIRGDGKIKDYKIMRIKMPISEVNRLNSKKVDLYGEVYLWAKIGLEFIPYNYNQYRKFKVIDEKLFTESSKKYKIEYKVMREVKVFKPV